MKKLLLLMVLVISILGKAQEYEQKTLKSIEYAFQAFDGNMLNSFQSEYILEKSNVVGKKYLAIGYPFKYNEILLNKENDIIKNATFINNANKINIELYFKDGNAERIVMDGYFDYKFKYNNDGVLIFSQNGSANVIYSIGFEGERIKTIVQAVRKNEYSKPNVSTVTKLEYQENSLTRSCISYKKDKEMNDKNILQKFIYKYSIVGDKMYAVEYLDNGIPNDKSNGKKIIYTYDNQNRLVKEDENTKEGKLVKMYSYLNGESRDFVKKIAIGDFQTDKYTFIDIKEDLPKTSDNMNDYEWRKGEYSLDGNNQIYFEMRDGKIRKKENGIWSDWKYADY